jgi:RNA polymerase sigma factor for flagellar operon FliA
MIKFKLPNKIDEEDLTNYAVIGLIDALRKYDVGKKTKFETYAMWRIKGAILDELRSLDWASRSARRKARDMQKHLQVLEQKLGRSVSEEEAAESLKLNSKDFSNSLKCAMILVGAKDLQELRESPLVLTGLTRSWLDSRGIPVERFIKRC